jgi:hypothetical protein
VAAGAAALALLATGPFGAQEPGTPASVDVERVRGLVLGRVSPWIKDARDRLREEVDDPRGVDRVLEELREEIWAIVREEVRGARIPAVLRPASDREKGKPPETSPAPTRQEGLAGRFDDKARLRSVHGGSGTEPALGKALEWLAAHQDPDGRWDCDGFSKNCAKDRCGGPGEPLHDVGVTGLALLAFLGDGNLPDGGPHWRAVARGVKWILSQQNPETGLLGGPAGNSFLYGHAIATTALAEAYALGGSGDLRGPLERAVALAAKACNPDRVWRYQCPPNGDNDTSVTSWMASALKAAADAGVAVDPTLFDRTLAWLEDMTEPATGRCGYMQRGEGSARRSGREQRFPAHKTEALTAAALFCRIRLGQTPEKHPVLRLHAGRLRKAPPVWEVGDELSLVDEYYWYYGTFAMFQMGGEDWKVWNAALKKALLEHQRKDGDAAGSWDPVGAWGEEGGRVYMTALGALCLESYYRYPRRAD